MAYTHKDEEKLFEEITTQFNLSKQYLDPIHERMNQQEELYRSFIDKNNYPHNARVFDPRVFRVIETVVPRMVANEPTGSFYPQEGGDVATTHILNAMSKYDWKRAGMFAKQVNAIKSMLIFGTFFGRTYWDFRETERTQMEPKTLNGRVVWTPKNAKKIKVTDFDGPNFEVLNIYDCFPDPNATSLDNMRWFIYRTFTTLEELKNENDSRGLEYWKNLDKLEAAINADKENKTSGGAGTTQDTQYREHRRLMLSTQEFHGKDSSNPEFVVLRRLTREGWCFIVPEHNIVIREVENPYFHGQLPLVHGVDYPYPGELYGMGEIEPIDRIQRAINAVLNQRLDNVQLTLKTMWKVKKGAGVDMHTLISAPGNIITTEDMNALERIDIPDVTGQAFVPTMNYLTAAMQNGSGITDYTIGINSNASTANETATGTRLIQQEANAVFKLKIQLYNHMVVEKIANQWKDLRIQYTTEEQKLRILGTEDVKYLREKTNLSQVSMDGMPIAPGEETPSKLEVVDEGFAFLNILPDDIQPSIVGNYDFVASTSSEQLTDPIAMQENFFSAIDRVTQPAFVQGMAQQGKMLNYQLISEKTFEKLNIGLEARDIVVDLPQQPQQPPQDGMPTDPTQDPSMQGQDPLSGLQPNPMDMSPESLPPIEAMIGELNGQPTA